ncbi:MAG TPA: serine/threonine protein kinase, partial [Myxococcales bacterium]|nr:serine/threonine protein kinase [Myxococcales bacterium]
MTSVTDTTVEQSPVERRVFGERFHVLEQIGSGGMATVYRGRDTTLSRDVAIKVLHPHLAARADARARFNREAHAIARLKHPNVVDVYDFSDTEEDDAFLVAEFVDGITLSDWYHRHGPLFPQAAALIGYAIAGALKHAHNMGIVHRDIKPDNLMISRSGQLKLMDFGIATVMDLDGMTATGAIIGSPAHMAPEQIEGDDIDERVDIFAFGTLLYFLSTGQLPFVAANPHALFRRILECDYEAASRLCPMVDRRMQELIDGCLQRVPEERISSMSGLQDALESYLRWHQFSEPERNLRQLLTTPEQFHQTWRSAIVESLCVEGRQLAKTGSLALAIDSYNRALAFDAEATEAKSGLSDLTSRSQRRGQKKPLDSLTA